MTWAVLDLETTIRSSFKRKANPFDPLNWIVMMGWATKASPKPEGMRLTQQNQGKVTEQFIELLKGTKLLVGVNIKFDLLYILRDPAAYNAWMDYVAAGGNVWDCQLAEYLLQGQIKSSHMLSMDDMAVYYDLDTKVDEVKMLWEAGVATEDIDPDLLARYLLGEDLKNPATGEVTGRREGDIGNTRDIFLRQVERAKAAGQSRSILLNMGSLLASIEMERNGMYVDKELGLQLAGELAAELAEARKELDSYLPKDLPFDFNWSNRYHLSPLLFGGRIKYERREYDLKDGTKTFDPPGEKDARYAYSQQDVLHYVLVDDSTMSIGEYESRLLRIPDGLSDPVPERVQYKSGKNAGEFKTKKVKADDYSKPKTRMAADYWEFPGYAVPDDEWASSTEGLYSVAGEIIEELTSRPDAVPFLKTLGRVAALSKDLGTYFITEDGDGNQKGMLTLVGEDGIVHHSINHTSTVTGRFSGSNPNLQNIPKGNKSKAKQMFVSRFEGGSILQSDFSALEVYVQANLTKCAALIQALLKGTDMHCLRLSKKEHMDYDEVFKLCKGWRETAADGTVIEHAAVDEWDYKRTGVKVFSFQLAYGAGAATIAKATGMALDEVEALMQAENELFPEIAEHFEKRGEEIQKNARATSSFVMHPANPAVKVQIMLSRIQLPSGKKYSYMSAPAPAFLLKRGVTSAFSPTERKNYEVQGEGAEVMKAAMWLAVREFYRHRNWGGKALLVNTVHDAQYADADPSVCDEVAAVLHSCMESATDFFCYWFKWQLSVPVPSDTVRGDNMGEEIPYKSDAFKAQAKQLRSELATRYMENFNPAYATITE
uniref:DNA-directed DNA polymerase n=1 Tax=feces metagenome TaxID=1861841 RepID=A0A7M2QN35_9ZZZZ